MKLSKIHFFNPGHETAVLVDSSNYTAPANVRIMMKDLSLLPAWYAEAGDLVITDHPEANKYLNTLPEEIAPAIVTVPLNSTPKDVLPVCSCVAEPWGISRHSLDVFRKLKRDRGADICIPEWKTEYYEMTGRYTANKVLANLCSNAREIEPVLTPCLCNSLVVVKQYMDQFEPPFVIKTPFSSSGRGILWLYSEELSVKDIVWIEGAIRKQGTVTIEKGLDKVVDFAVEFYSDGAGNIIYHGLSLFSTGERGAYSGNILMNQSKLWEYLDHYISKDKLNKVIEALITQLRSFYGSSYTGYLGVDMMIYENKGYYLHPCVEINMRYTMGLVAIKIFDKVVDQSSEGVYQVEYFKEASEANNFNYKIRNEYPLKMKEDKIVSGYLSLCPVDEETHYIAYILIK